MAALQSALSGLRAQRTRLDVIGHNVSNVGTEGYSRQRVDLASGGKGPIPAVFSDGLVTGDGVDVVGITRYRDEFLEARALVERSATGDLQTQMRYFDRIEMAHPEPSDTGLASSLDRFWGAFDDLANQPGQIPARTAVLEQAQATIGQFGFMDSQLRTVRATAVSETEALVERINVLATEVAGLNDAIRPILISGTAPNDLLDQRDTAISELSSLAGVTIQNRDDGTIDVFLGGSSLVTSGRAVPVEATTVVDPTLADVGVQRVVLQWSNGAEITPNGGDAAALLRMANTEIPDAIRALDSVAAGFVADVNAIHVAAQDLDGATGWNFFDPAGTTAGTIALSADVVDQPRRIAAAVAGGGQLDASAAQAIAALRDAPGGASEAYAELVGGLGVQVGSVRARTGAQTDVMQRVDQARLSERAVNLDEEMIEMVSAQRAYEASARMITAIDEILETLVNRLGLVGR